MHFAYKFVFKKMAKINHSNYLDVADNVISSGVRKGVMHIQSNELNFDGKNFLINNKEVKNFGTCGYLGLEMHPDLIEGSIDLTRRFGTQFSMSRTYLKAPYTKELEDLISQIFNGCKTICFSSTSTAHISVLNTLIKPDDLIVLDQQVHFSVQYPCKALRTQGTEVKMIRHSNYEMLEEILINEANNYQKIWYMADGVYSMHGDFPDIERLKQLMDKYPKLNLYFDDAHGMGWDGKNGAGYVFDRLGLSDRIILISTLAKGFGSIGGTAIFFDEETHRRVSVFGGPLTYSHPLNPSTVGAAIASAKIHLSDKIYTYQRELKELYQHASNKLIEYNLPDLSAPTSPIFFIGCGGGKVAINLVNRMVNEGYYVNPGIFPAVANDKSGLRFTITRHNTKENINSFIEALAHHHPKAIEEENENLIDVFKTFHLPFNEKVIKKQENMLLKSFDHLKLEIYDCIEDVNQKEWDEMFESRGNISHSGMKCIEEIFQNNDEKENNWTFHYIIIRDKYNKIVLSTFFTGTYIKDDMIALENVSKKIEEVRKTDPYYLCTKTLVMGCMFADGNFIHIDESNENWNDAAELLFKTANDLKLKIEAKSILLRDFEENHPMCELMENEGFAKVQMPNSLVVENPKWDSYEDLLSLIPSKKKRYNIKHDAIRHENKFEITYKQKISDSESELYYNLFENIKDSNFDFNFFKFPKKIASVISKHDNWEFIDIKIKGNNKTIASIWSYIGKNHYSPLIMGLNYDYIESHQIYKQSIFQIVKRGNYLNKSKTYLGFSAEFEKTKYLANVIPIYAFIKVDDTYNMELVESYSNTL
jgi:7-keto-8-aminopelargonate synthetase-like enzyme